MPIRIEVMGMPKSGKTRLIHQLIKNSTNDDSQTIPEETVYKFDIFINGSFEQPVQIWERQVSEDLKEIVEKPSLPNDITILVADCDQPNWNKIFHAFKMACDKNIRSGENTLVVIADSYYKGFDPENETNIAEEAEMLGVSRSDLLYCLHTDNCPELSPMLTKKVEDIVVSSSNFSRFYTYIE